MAQDVLVAINDAAALLQKVVDAQKAAVESSDPHDPDSDAKKLGKEFDALPLALTDAAHKVIYGGADPAGLVEDVALKLKAENEKNAQNG